MKVGDKLVCKKDTHSWLDGRISKGDMCVVDRVYANLVNIKKITANTSLIFTTNYRSEVDEHIWDHFYTEKEARKIKLSKIYENR